MNSDDTTFADGGSIRDAHRELTRERILDAAIEALNDEGLDALTIAGVAKQAGVTDRTVYRHFPTRDDLLAHTWTRLRARVLPQPDFPRTARALVETPRTLFPNFDADAGAMRAAAFSPAGRELRRSANAARQEAFMAAVRDARPDLDGDALVRMAAVVQLLESSLAWASMSEFWGLDGEASGRAASEAIALLLGVDLDSTSDPAAQKPPAKTKD